MIPINCWPNSVAAGRALRFVLVLALAVAACADDTDARLAEYEERIAQLEDALATTAPTDTTTSAVSTSTVTASTASSTPQASDAVAHVVLDATGPGQSDLGPLLVVESVRGPGPVRDDQLPRELADFDIAAGVDSVLAVSNFGLGLYAKDGERLAFSTILDFFRPEFEERYRDNYPALDCPEDGPEDPACHVSVGDGEIRAVYDPGSRRYFVVAATTFSPCSPSDCPSYFALAVSKSEAPSSLSADEWHLYSFGGEVRGPEGLLLVSRAIQATPGQRQSVSKVSPRPIS